MHSWEVRGNREKVIYQLLYREDPRENVGSGVLFSQTQSSLVTLSQ